MAPTTIEKLRAAWTNFTEDADSTRKLAPFGRYDDDGGEAFQRKYERFCNEITDFAGIARHPVVWDEDLEGYWDSFEFEARLDELSHALDLLYPAMKANPAADALLDAIETFLEAYYG
jgi:hypothetical protein